MPSAIVICLLGSSQYCLRANAHHIAFIISNHINTSHIQVQHSVIYNQISDDPIFSILSLSYIAVQ